MMIPVVPSNDETAATASQTERCFGDSGSVGTLMGHSRCFASAGTGAAIEMLPVWNACHLCVALVHARDTCERMARFRVKVDAARLLDVRLVGGSTAQTKFVHERLQRDYAVALPGPRLELNAVIGMPASDLQNWLRFKWLFVWGMSEIAAAFVEVSVKPLLCQSKMQTRERAMRGLGVELADQLADGSLSKARLGMLATLAAHRPAEGETGQSWIESIFACLFAVINKLCRLDK